MDKRIQWAISRMLEVVNAKFYGSFTITFRAGKLHDLRIDRTEKPSDYGIE